MPWAYIVDSIGNNLKYSWWSNWSKMVDDAQMDTEIQNFE